MRLDTRVRNRRGMALFVSIVAIIVVGALVTAVMATTTLEQRTGETTRRQNQAFAVADAAMGGVVANWVSGSWNMMTVGTSQNISGTSPNGTGTYTGSVSRVNSEIFLLDVTGKDRASQARQRLAMLVKLRILKFDIGAALTTRGAGTIGGSADINGEDLRPWNDCPPAGAAAAGVRHPDPDDLDFIGGCSGASCVSGSPSVQGDPSVNDNTFFNYADNDWEALKANANIVLSGGTYTQLKPSVSDGNCNITDVKNWGEPSRPGTVAQCYNYFPIIYFDGDAHVSQGRGQGILLVNGDFQVNGNFEFAGVVVVRGRLRSQGTGNKVSGGILAANVDLETSQVLGNATLNFSRCAIDRAQNASAPSAMFRSRGWMQVF